MALLFSALPVLMGTTSTASSASSTGSMMTTFVTFGLIIVIFYFLIIRPQKKREKETKNMIDSIKKGDKIVTIGGIRGTVLSVKEGTVVVKVDDTTKIEFTKGAIASVVDKKAETAAAEKVEAPAAKAAPKKSTSKKTTKKKESVEATEVKEADKTAVTEEKE